MKFENVPFTVTDWNRVSSVGMRGETGKAISKEFDQGNVRVRLVEYSVDYKSDHWCTKGHIVLVLEGDLTVELEDGKKYNLKGDMSLQVGDNVTPHKVCSKNGARVIIFD
ncbi:MAG: DHCW motif cupin fold protein [Bacteroidetes bacterium]|nr:DHCW motif cupin fold protein [Bacteroidota bacterium]